MNNLGKLLFNVLLICLVISCKKEARINTNDLDIKNLYTISDDPNDPVQHKRYELYKTYGVPIYFTDTIGKNFVKIDVNGDSVFCYETLDLNWSFNSSSQGSVSYQVSRITDPEKQLKALNFAETFLKVSNKALYPYAMWLTEKCYQLSSAGVEQLEVVSRYRNLLLASADTFKEEEYETKALAFRNEVIKLKVLNFTEDVNVFKKVTDAKYYGQYWWNLFPNEVLPYWRKVDWYPEPLLEEWKGDGTFRRWMTKYGNLTNSDWPEGVWTNEQVDEYIEYTRKVIGSLGFISTDTKTSKKSPSTTAMDLDSYIQAMLATPKDEFLKKWEHSSLVTKKYMILYTIIKDKMGVEL